MAIYKNYPKPNSDMTKGRSAKKVSSATGGGQSSVSGAMGKHQKTGSGAEGAKGSSHG